MISIKTILCPTDFSDCSGAALALATDLAKSLGAKLHVLHVFQLPSYVGWEDGMVVAAASLQILDQLRKRADEALAAQLDACRKAGVEASVEQVDGLPYHQIVQRSPSFDLVVMGTHGRTGLPRLMLGSVAERVVRLAKCPVITVPAPAKG